MPYGLRAANVGVCALVLIPRKQRRALTLGTLTAV